MKRAFPTRRVVLLGASNLVRGISTVVETCTNMLGGPIDVLAALGHGRSYGMESRVLGRALPGITSCGIWDALNRRPRLPAYGLITDIGNDILYGAASRTIASWVETCLVRMLEYCERIVVTELPLENVLRLGPRRFAIIRSLIFPSARISYDETITAVTDLNDRVMEISARYGARLVQPRRVWYGIDPIHIKLRHWSMAWREVLSAWCAGASFDSARGSLRHWILLRGLRPQQRSFFGHVQRQQQPAGRLPDGSLVSFF